MQKCVQTTPAIVTEQPLQQEDRLAVKAAVAARSVDKAELQRTGGGRYTPQYTEEQALMLANVATDQFEPLHNEFDTDRDHHNGIYDFI